MVGRMMYDGPVLESVPPRGPVMNMCNNELAHLTIKNQRNLNQKATFLMNMDLKMSSEKWWPFGQASLCCMQFVRMHDTIRF